MLGSKKLKFMLKVKNLKVLLRTAQAGFEILHLYVLIFSYFKFQHTK